jgi:hypothetical protein
LTRVLSSIAFGKTWNGMRPCVAHFCEFGSIADAIVMGDKRVKLDGKGFKMRLSWIMQRYKSIKADVFGNKENHKNKI